MRDTGARRSRPARPDINITPLIDILLVLLIIFMVITPLRPARFKTLVPEAPADSKDVRKSPRTLVVEIDGDARLSLIRGGDVIAEASLEDEGALVERLAAEWAERKAKSDWRPEMLTRVDVPPDERIERTVFVKAPRSIGYGKVAKLIDGIKGAGAQPIGLQTDALTN
ncbi:MAG TPA: biopolymer transporter ExbD [Pyrinomonadaceae bacterium]|jgi:biopolymer transport protein ExbD|nr:biopolymer transporter ExbD [Pyrinomonadaceae bacterium]